MAELSTAPSQDSPSPTALRPAAGRDLPGRPDGAARFADVLEGALGNTGPVASIPSPIAMGPAAASPVTAPRMAGAQVVPTPISLAPPAVIPLAGTPPAPTGTPAPAPKPASAAGPTLAPPQGKIARKAADHPPPASTPDPAGPPLPPQTASVPVPPPAASPASAATTDATVGKDAEPLPDRAAAAATIAPGPAGLMPAPTAPSPPLAFAQAVPAATDPPPPHPAATDAPSQTVEPVPPPEPQAGPRPASRPQTPDTQATPPPAASHSLPQAMPVQQEPARAKPAPDAEDPAVPAIPPPIMQASPHMPEAAMPGTSPAPETASAPVAPQVAPQIVPAVLHVVSGESGTRITLQLTPQELGRVDIQIDRPADGPAQISLTAERPETLALLQHDQSQLHEALDRAGIPTGQLVLSFHLASPDGATAFAPVAPSQSTPQQDPSGARHTPQDTPPSQGSVSQNAPGQNTQGQTVAGGTGGDPQGRGQPGNAPPRHHPPGPAQPESEAEPAGWLRPIPATAFARRAGLNITA